MTRHPLVIVLVIAVIGIGFYYYASPYENCTRELNYDGEFAALANIRTCGEAP